jgi:hypothetical protein
MAGPVGVLWRPLAFFDKKKCTFYEVQAYATANICGKIIGYEKRNAHSTGQSTSGRSRSSGHAAVGLYGLVYHHSQQAAISKGELWQWISHTVQD